MISFVRNTPFTSIMRFTLAMIAFVLVTHSMMAADKTDPQKPSPLVSQSAVIYYTTPATNSEAATAHRAVIAFGAKGATCELFSGVTIPFTAMVKTQQTSGKGKGKSRTVMTDFTAKGETTYGNGTISFTASKDGDGAKGTVILNKPNQPSVTIMFTGKSS